MDKSAKLLWLSQEDVIATGVLDEGIGHIIDAEVKAYSLIANGEGADPVAPQVHFQGDQAGNIFAIHPAWVAGDVNVAGMKLGARAPENRKVGMPSITSIVEMINPENGRRSALATPP